MECPHVPCTCQVTAGDYCSDACRTDTTAGAICGCEHPDCAGRGLPGDSVIPPPVPL